MRSLAPSARTSVCDLVAGNNDAACNIVFLLIQLERRQHPTDLCLHFVAIAGLADCPENITIHLAVSRVRFYPLRFNSSGYFCDGGATCSRGTVSARNLVLGRECGLHSWNVENNLQSDGESILKSPEVHDRHIEATASALNNAVASSDDRDTVAAIDNAFDGHMVLQVRIYFAEKDLCLLK